jgi:hypothetical protein
VCLGALVYGQLVEDVYHGHYPPTRLRPGCRRISTAPFWRESSPKVTLRLTLELAYPLAGDT